MEPERPAAETRRAANGRRGSVRKIIERFDRLSAPYGTTITRADGLGVWCAPGGTQRRSRGDVVPIIPKTPFRLERNRHVDRVSPVGPDPAPMLWHRFHEDAWREIQEIPNYRATPLRELRQIATRADVAQILYKDEADRFGLGSFKGLGSVYAVIRAVGRQLQHLGLGRLHAGDMQRDRWRQAASELTVSCATDGNHGRAVAWGATLVGCQCIVYLPSHVSPGRERAIVELGARTIRVDGNYDEAVRVTRKDADRYGWVMVSDTSHDVSEPTPVDVMCGYMALAREVVDRLGVSDGLTHIFVQAGVGGLAAAVCAYWWQLRGAERPTLIVVESDQADCLLRSALLGRPSVVRGEHDTIMAGLACGAPSAVAWPILEKGADYFMAISDQAAIATMRLLGHDPEGCGPLVAGESGVVGLAAFLLCASDDHARGFVHLDDSSRVLVIGTEGATDAEMYASLLQANPAAE